MQAISPEALPLPATLKGVTTYGQRNGLLFMLKGPRLKTVSYRTFGFPEYGMANVSNFTRGFTPASNPERGNNMWATKLAFIYVKRAKAKKHQRPAHTPRHSQLHLRRRLVHRVARKRLQHHRSVTHVCPEHYDHLL